MADHRTITLPRDAGAAAFALADCFGEDFDALVAAMNSEQKARRRFAALMDTVKKQLDEVEVADPAPAPRAAPARRRGGAPARGSSAVVAESARPGDEHSGPPFQGGARLRVSPAPPPQRTIVFPWVTWG